MEKKKLSYLHSYIEEVEFVIDGNDFRKITVKNFIPYQYQLLYISEYLTTYFLSDEALSEGFLVKWNYLGAENELMLKIVDNHTDIMVFDEEENLVLDLDGFLASGIWEEITHRIVNWENFRDLLYISVENVKATQYLDNSFLKILKEGGKLLEGLVEKLADVEFTEEGFRSISDAVTGLQETIKDSPVSSLVDESKKK